MATRKLPRTKIAPTVNQRSKKEDILQGTVNVIPNCSYSAKQVVECVGLGIYSGNYYVNKVIHKISNGNYTTTLQVRLKALGAASGGSSGSSAEKEEVAEPPRKEAATVTTNSAGIKAVGIRYDTGRIEEVDTDASLLR